MSDSLKLEIGDKLKRVSDLMTYTVVYEDKFCYYLCLFKGSTSSIYNFSKCRGAQVFYTIFSCSTEGALRVKITDKKQSLEFYESQLCKLVH